MKNKEFNLRNYLYKNPLLEGEEKDEASKKALDKKEDELDEKDMDHEDLKEKIKHHEGAIKNIKKELEDLSTDLDEDEEDLKKEKEDVKETALRNLIREKINSILLEADEDVDVEEEEDVDVDVEKDVDVDVEDEVDIDDESVESDIEVKTEVPGEDADTSAVLGLLTKAQEESESLGDEKLMDQIGNTITYFTRAHVVKSTGTRAELEEDREINEFLGFGSDIKKGGTLWVSGTEGNTRFRKIDKGVYKVEGTNQASFYVGEIWKPGALKKLKVGQTIPLFGEILKLGDGKEEYKKLKI